jgi:hypothetical protein
MMLQRIIRRIERFFELERWNLGLIDRQPDDISELVSSGRLSAVKWCLAPTRSVYRADPFIWRREGRAALLFEEYYYWRGKGDIRSIATDNAFRNGVPITEISEPTHLSYPQILSDGAKLYCIPESAESGGLSLYERDATDSRWVLSCRLLAEEVVDPTFMRLDGVWYLFGTLLEDDPQVKLRIWWSLALQGPWNRHALNPVISDEDGSRPAGPIFSFSGHHYRPAQVCAGGYGTSIKIFRIECLSPSTYTETLVSRVYPDPNGPYPHGLHTLMIDDEHIAIDGKRIELNLTAPIIRTIWRVTHYWRKLSVRRARAK